MSINILSILRFTAAIIVILFHQKSAFPFLKDSPKIVTAGPQMVTFFFVLSGFVLILAYGNKEKFPAKEFFVKRFSRIIPVYLVALFLAAFLLLIQGKFDLLSFVLNLFFLQAWIPPYPSTINSPGWFLSNLAFFYLSFPLIFIYFKRYSPNPKIILYFSLALWLFTQIILTVLLNTQFYKGSPSVSHDLIFYFPLSHYCSFFLGAAGAYLLTRNFRDRFLDIKSLKFVILSSIFIIISIEYQTLISGYINMEIPYGSSFYAPFFLFFIGSLYLLKKDPSKDKVIGQIEILGKISFSMYIMQSPISTIVFHILDRFILPDAIRLFLYLLILILVCLGLLNCIENPIINRMQKKFILQRARP